MDACSSDIDACSLPVEVTTAVHVAQEHALGVAQWYALRGEAACTQWRSGMHSEVKQHARHALGGEAHVLNGAVECTWHTQWHEGMHSEVIWHGRHTQG
eukprot:1160613-Pelagomonas_calceolata.AAC.6